MDYALVKSILRLAATRWRRAPQLVVTSKHGRADHWKKGFKDGRMHVGMKRYDAQRRAPAVDHMPTKSSRSPAILDTVANLIMEAARQK